MLTFVRKQKAHRMSDYHLIVSNDFDNEEVDLSIDLPEIVSMKKHASLGLLYMLAIMELDADGVIADKMDALLRDGPINEIDATNAIRALITRG
jgi:hypothetical protein